MPKIRNLTPLLGFDKHLNVGGACGEIAVDTGRGCSLLLTSPLAASQNFEVCLLFVWFYPSDIIFVYVVQDVEYPVSLHFISSPATGLNPSLTYILRR